MNNNSFVCLECVKTAHEGLRLLAENGCEDFPILGCCDCAACDKDTVECPTNVFTDEDFGKWADVVAGYVTETVAVDPFDEYNHTEWMQQHPMYQPTAEWEFEDREYEINGCPKHWDLEIEQKEADKLVSSSIEDPFFDV